MYFVPVLHVRLVEVLMKGTIAIGLHLGTLVLVEGGQVIRLLGMEGTKVVESLQKLSFTAGGRHLVWDVFNGDHRWTG